MKTSKIFLKISLIMIACFVGLILLAVLFYNVENWRGERAWKQCQQKLEAKGEKLNWQAFVPPPIPSDKNLAMGALFKPLFANDEADKKKVANDDLPIQKVRIDFQKHYKFPKGLDAHSWRFGKRYDLKAWQNFYAKFLPKNAASQTPATNVLSVLSRFDPILKTLREEAAKTSANALAASIQKESWNAHSRRKCFRAFTESLTTKGDCGITTKPASQSIR